MVEKNGWGEWYRLNVWVYPQIPMLKPKPQCDVLGGAAFGRNLHHAGGSLMNGISALLKETPENSLTPSAMWGHGEEMASYAPGGGSSPDAESASLILDFLVSRAVRNTFLMLTGHPVCGILL